VVRLLATERATISEVPPGAKGTTKRMAFSGYCAQAREKQHNKSAPNETRIFKADILKINRQVNDDNRVRAHHAESLVSIEFYVD
jgi:hypothetical protein